MEPWSSVVLFPAYSTIARDLAIAAIEVEEPWSSLSRIRTEDERKARLVEVQGQIRNERSALRPTTSISWRKDLDDIMSELESSQNFSSFVNGDGDNDVTEVYENDEDNQHDVGLEDEEEVDSKVQNDDDGGEFQHQIEGYNEKKKKAGHRKMSASDIMQVENYRKVGIRPPHMYATFTNQCGGYDKVGFIRKNMYNEVGRMRKQHTSDARGALKYLYDLRKKDPMIVNHHNQTIVFAPAIVTDETEETYVWLLEQLLVAIKGKDPCSIIADGDLAMRNAIRRVMPGVFHRLCAWHLLRNALSHVRDKQVLKWLKNLMLGDFEVVEFEEKWNKMVATFELEDNTWIAELTIKLRVINCKEMVTFSVYWVVKYCSGSVWRVSYCPSMVDFTCSCMRMHSIGLPCDHILAVLVSLNFMELPSSLVLNRWSKVATENIKDKYPDSAIYWDSQLMASEHCVDDNDEQQQHGDDFDGILDPVVVRSKGCGQVRMDDSSRQRRIQKCGQCGLIGHNKRSCTNHTRNGNASFGASSSEQTNSMLQPTHENNNEVFMQQPQTFVAGSSRLGP
ncbi:Protein FAR1-RELATED SEQUENCE 5 [Glycine soja]|uniref:Protein FAR1-RELATED SEQUENCE 5 n=1 Tax=Glycine soja TaxID=3848 RepID=A0A0B2RH23_GLYSO|nr:Protein FAR1-RELATED SEQUENCE 5 [Glycine soja]